MGVQVISFGDRKDPFLVPVEKMLLTPKMADEQSRSHIDQLKDRKTSGDKTKQAVDIYPVGYQFRRTISATFLETNVNSQTHCPVRCPVPYLPLLALCVLQERCDIKIQGRLSRTEKGRCGSPSPISRS